MSPKPESLGPSPSCENTSRIASSPIDPATRSFFAEGIARRARRLIPARGMSPEKMLGISIARKGKFKGWPKAGERSGAG